MSPTQMRRKIFTMLWAEEEIQHHCGNYNTVTDIGHLKFLKLFFKFLTSRWHLQKDRRQDNGIGILQIHHVMFVTLRYVTLHYMWTQSVSQSLFLWNTRLQICTAHLSTQNISKFISNIKTSGNGKQKKIFIDIFGQRFLQVKSSLSCNHQILL